jgi:hypothetical protein
MAILVAEGLTEVQVRSLDWGIGNDSCLPVSRTEPPLKYDQQVIKDFHRVTEEHPRDMKQRTGKNPYLGATDRRGWRSDFLNTLRVSSCRSFKALGL